MSDDLRPAALRAEAVPLRTAPGEPAFPVPDGPWYYCGHPGMSIREWFAGQAVIGMILAPAADGMDPRTYPEAIAKGSFLIADAMLAEAGKGG